MAKILRSFKKSFFYNSRWCRNFWFIVSPIQKTMDHNAIVESLARCFPGKWFSTENEEEKIAFEIFLSPSSFLQIGLSVRLKPGCDPLITVGERKIAIDHPLIAETKKMPASWESVFEIVKRIRSYDYRSCDGISDPEAIAVWNSDRRPPSTTVIQESTNLYAENCQVFIRRQKRGAVTGSCLFCRACQEKLLQQRIGDTTPAKYSKYSRGQLLDSLLEKDDKIKNISVQLTRAEKQLSKLAQLRLRPAVERCLEIVEEDMDSKEPSIPNMAALFLQHQLRCLLATDSHGMRWKIEIILFSIRLHLKSASAYEFLIDSGAIKLPSSSTISRFLSKIPAASGFNDSIISSTVTEYFANYKQPYAKYFAMSIDEMKIKANLVFDQKSNELVGYVDSTEAMNEFGKELTEAQRIATDVLVIFIRGIGTGFQCAIGWFPVRSLCAGEIMSIVWTAKQKLEFFSFKDGSPRLKVVTVTCDGLAANHLFFKLHGCGDLSKLEYKAADPLDPSNFLYFIVDPPHLVKTMRNNAEKSDDDEEATKYLVCDDLPILWRHFEELYLDDVKNTWRMLPKLSYRHIYITGSDKMKVKLATQLLSKSVSVALSGRPGMESTSKFCSISNRMFDIMNGRHPEEARHKRNDDLAPFRSPTDRRLTWLLDECYGYFCDWENSVNSTDLSRSEKQRRLLSVQTRAALYVTIHGFVEAVRWILSQPDAPPYILSGVFNQDRLETYFGHVRAAGGSCDHPDWNRFRRIASVLNLIKISDLKTVRGSNVSDPDGNSGRRHSL